MTESVMVLKWLMEESERREPRKSIFFLCDQGNGIGANAKTLFFPFPYFFFSLRLLEYLYP